MSNYLRPDEPDSISPKPEDNESHDSPQTPYDEFNNRIAALARRWRQRSSFNWGNAIQLGMLGAVAVYAALTFKLWRTTDASLREIQKQTRAQETAFRLTHRPWLEVQVAAEPLRIYE